MVLVFEGGEVVALAVAFGAGEEEVGEKLHLNLFKAISPTALTTSGARVEGEVARLEIFGLGLWSEDEELANCLKGS